MVFCTSLQCAAVCCRVQNTPVAYKHINMNIPKLTSKYKHKHKNKLPQISHKEANARILWEPLEERRPMEGLLRYNHLISVVKRHVQLLFVRSVVRLAFRAWNKKSQTLCRKGPLASCQTRHCAEKAACILDSKKEGEKKILLIKGKVYWDEYCVRE